MNVRGLWPLRDLPSAIWLVAAVLVALVHPFVPQSRWLLVHLLLLGALTHAVMVWSEHFTASLLRSAAPSSRRAADWRLLTLAIGVATVATGIVAGTWWAIAWWAVLFGAIAVGLAVVWHAVVLVQALRRALPSRFRRLVHFYVASAAFLPFGVGFGVWLAAGPTGDWAGRVLVAHSLTNLLGWVGLTVAGTLVTFWPTMLRTRMAERAEVDARRALPLLCVGVIVAVGGALVGWPALAGAGVLGYLAGWAMIGRGLLVAARQRPPRSFAGLSVGAAILWLPVLLAWLIVTLGQAATRPQGWAYVEVSYDTLAALAAVGFAAQLLLGALSFLIPMVLGGGPNAARAATAKVDAAAGARVAVVNAGLVVCVAPVPSLVRVVVSSLMLVALASALPLLALSIRASLRVRRTGQEVPMEDPDPVIRARALGQAVAGLAVVALAVSVGVGLDPVAAGLSSSGVAAAGPGGAAAGAAPVTGHVTTVRVEARDMRFVPDRIEVPTGDSLRIELVNTDPTTVHDLVLASGATSARLAPGASEIVDAGVISADVAGWCSVVGHRQMGMVFTIVATGAGPAAASGASEAAGHGAGAAGDPAGTDRGAAADLDFAREPSSGFTPYDAVLPPLTAETTRRVTFTVEEVEVEISPGVRQMRWTYNGAVPGPTLHGRVGDVFEVTLVNKGSMGHSIDFHAGEVSPEVPMRTIPPGESLVYRFTAGRAGIWMYHCSTMPMSSHIAAGMHGAVIIEPPDLPAVDRSYVLVQSEVYLGAQGDPVNADKVAAERPDAVVFNGLANQYDHAPLPAKVGERVRFWVLDAGPNRPSSFHIVGGQFDTMYLEGAYTLYRGRGALGPRTSSADPGAGSSAGGAQALGLQAAQGGFVEAVFPEPGRYPMVSHVMIDAERGAHGLVEVR